MDSVLSVMASSSDPRKTVIRAPPNAPNGSMNRASGSQGLLHNPSYNTRPELFHAIALQQQRLTEFKINLGPTTTLRRRAAVPPFQAAPTAPPPPQPASDDSDDGDDRPSKAPPKLTLAQRMGLAEAPEPELTASEWDHIADMSRHRDLSRQPCVICCEPFRDEKQVLLSCGHTFHRQCLRSWERHSKSRCCPVCRKQHYRKRQIADGANLYREECAIKLQAYARGAAARRRTAKALRHVNPVRMRRYCEDRLGGLTDELVGRIERERSEVDDLFAEIDGTIAASRVLMGGELDWDQVEQTARTRGLGDCPVCLAPLCSDGSSGHGERLALLSCTHVFHHRCLESFERFSLTPACLCPVCRSAYSKTDMTAGEPGTVVEILDDGGAADVEQLYGGAVVDGLCQECCPASSSAAPRCTGRARSNSSRASACSSSSSRASRTSAPVARSAAGRVGSAASEKRFEAIERLIASGDRAAAAASRGRGRGGGSLANIIR